MTRASATPPYRYQLFGWTVASDLPCPELVAASGDAPPRLEIRYDPTAANPPLDKANGAAHWFAVEGVAAYRVERGRSIAVAPAPGARAEEVRLYLFASAFAAALHQGRRLPLHVSAVLVDGAVHAFCGASGAGKSTLAAALRRRGVTVLCDDVGVVERDAEGTALFHPGVPRLKLWRDALDQLGMDTRDAGRDLTREEKFHFTLPPGGGGLPLRSLFRLERAGRDEEEPVLEPLDNRAILMTLLEHTYRPRLLARVGDPRWHLTHCAAIATAIHGYRFSRPWRLDRLDAGLDPLLALLTGATPAAIVV